MYFSRIWSKWLFNICQDSFDKMVLLQRRWKNANANIWKWSSVDQNFPRNVCYLLFWALLKCNATIIYQFSCLFGKWWRDNLFLPLNFPSGKSFPKSNSWQIIIREGKPPRRFEYYANGQTDRIKFMKQVEATNIEKASKKSCFYRVFFFTGSAQKVLSMELVPPNSKKTTKYTGSAQYTKNG